MRMRLGLAILLMAVPVHGQVRPGAGPWRNPNRGEVVEPLQWGTAAAGHLLRRAGFSASPDEVKRAVNQGFDATVDELLEFDSVDDSSMERGLNGRNYSLVRIADNGVERADAANLQNWWLYRMINSRRQLLEKMTLFWHDHFATSIGEINQVDGAHRPLMLVQNETIRQHALGNFKEMVHAIARDPAMIIWLNNLENIAGSPNENWARELMELFTMGEGNGYTQQDIEEAARAFTGWSLVRPRDRSSQVTLSFIFRPQFHDYGPKTVLGQTLNPVSGDSGISDGEKVIEIIFQQPQVAEFIVAKLWDWFVYPDPPRGIVTELAQQFRSSGYEIAPLMRAIFEHPHFLSTKAYRAKIKSPVEFGVGVYRELGLTDPGLMSRLTEVLGLGQNLFYPPDVGGWTSDEGWINTGTVLGRFNFMNCLISSRPNERGCFNARLSALQPPIPVAEIIASNQLILGSSVVGHFLNAMVQNDVSVDTRYVLEEYMEVGDDGMPEPFDVNNPVLVDKKVLGLIYLVSLLPVYQLN